MVTCDGPERKPNAPQVQALRNSLEGEDLVVTNGVILQELLQGFAGPRARENIIDRFSAFPFSYRIGTITSRLHRFATCADAPACSWALSTPCSRSFVSTMT